MKRLLRYLVLIAVPAAPLPTLAAGIAATLYKDPNCGCCEDHAKYLKANGFDVTVVPTKDLIKMQEASGVPSEFAGCHTLRIGEHVFEGHIPAASIKRFLKERPAAKGLSVPGMPAGSPGMSGTREGPLHVYIISNTTPPTVYDTYQ